MGRIKDEVYDRLWWGETPLTEGKGKTMSDDRRSLNSLDDIEFVVARIEELEAKLAKAVEALEFYTYETTHLSAEEDDGSHWCKISKGCLDHARTTLAELSKERSDEKGQDDE